MIIRQLVLCLERGQSGGTLYGVKRFIDFDTLPEEESALATRLVLELRNLERALEEESRPAEFDAL